MTKLIIGQEFRVKYPFYKEKYTEYDEEGFCIVDSWRPGIRFEQEQPDSVISIADGEGQMILKIISIHKPGKYPTRIFFLRKWEAPDGKEFGKNRLLITTSNNFVILTKGYRYNDYIVREKEEN